MAGRGDIVCHGAGYVLAPPQNGDSGPGRGQAASHGTPKYTGAAGDNGNLAFQ